MTPSASERCARCGHKEASLDLRRRKVRLHPTFQFHDLLRYSNLFYELDHAFVPPEAWE